MKSDINIIAGLQDTIKSVFKLSNSNNETLLNCFKVLIYDEYTYNIICPLLKVYNLREENISSNVLITSKRDRVPDVMAIYFVLPSKDNFSLIKKDLDSQLFDNYYFVFADICKDNLMQDFFSLLLESNSYNRVYKIESRPIGVYSYHTRVFSFNVPNSYFLLNSNKTRDEDISQYISSMGNSLMNLIFNLKTIPTIKYRQGWFAETIITELQKTIDYIFQKFPEAKSSLVSNPNSNTVLIILDRESDIPILLHHSASLGSLIHDLIGIDRKSKQSEKSLLVDPVDDYIWNRHCSESYIDNVDNKIREEVKKIEEETKFLSEGGLGVKDTEEIMKVSERMYNAIDNMKDIQIKKNILSSYSRFHKEILNHIETRNLGMYYNYEQDMLINRKISNDTRKYILDLLDNKYKLDFSSDLVKYDIVRILLIYYMTNQKVSPSDLKEIEDALNKLCPSLLSSFKFLKYKREFNDSLSISGMKTKNGYLSKGVSYLFNSLGNILTSNQPSLLSDIIYNLSIGKDVPGFVEYSLLKKDKVTSTSSFANVILFVVGGGGFSEFEAIDGYIKSKGKNFIYGSDTLYSPNEFVDELIKIYNNNNSI